MNFNFSSEYDKRVTNLLKSTEQIVGKGNMYFSKGFYRRKVLYNVFSYALYALITLGLIIVPMSETNFLGTAALPYEILTVTASLLMFLGIPTLGYHLTKNNHSKWNYARYLHKIKDSAAYGRYGIRYFQKQISKGVPLKEEIEYTRCCANAMTEKIAEIVEIGLKMKDVKPENCKHKKQYDDLVKIYNNVSYTVREMKLFEVYFTKLADDLENGGNGESVVLDPKEKNKTVIKEESQTEIKEMDQAPVGAKSNLCYTPKIYTEEDKEQE